MQMNEHLILTIISLFVGVLGRVFIPWLAKRQQDPENAQWSWQYVWPQLLSFGLIVLLLPLVVDNLESIALLEPQAAWLLGWGAADIGRTTYKALAGEYEE